jgi:hypothetical protein
MADARPANQTRHNRHRIERVSSRTFANDIVSACVFYLMLVLWRETDDCPPIAASTSAVGHRDSFRHGSHSSHRWLRGYLVDVDSVLVLELPQNISTQSRCEFSGQATWAQASRCLGIYLLLFYHYSVPSSGPTPAWRPGSCTARPPRCSSCRSSPAPRRSPDPSRSRRR